MNVDERNRKVLEDLTEIVFKRIAAEDEDGTVRDANALDLVALASHVLAMRPYSIEVGKKRVRLQLRPKA